MNSIFSKNLSFEGMLRVGELGYSLSPYAKLLNNWKIQLINSTLLYFFLISRTFALKEKCITWVFECLLFEFMYYSEHLLHESVLLPEYFIHFAVNYKSRKIFKTKYLKKVQVSWTCYSLIRHLLTKSCCASTNLPLANTYTHTRTHKVVLWFSLHSMQKQTFLLPGRVLNFKIV